MNINKVISNIKDDLKQPLWGNWYIKEEIGSGAFSAVYRIEAKRNTRIDSAALKIEPITADDRLFPSLEKKKSFIEKKKQSVENESTIMYKLRKCHNIVAYEDEDMQELVVNGEFEGYYFLIRMELLTCVSNLIKDRQMDFSENNVLKLAKQIGEGIRAAHDIGVIHRDIKPDNFFISTEGVYKLGDFNVSKLSESAKTFAGTNGYLAPEIYRAKNDSDENYTRQADIYSFGITLYQFMNDLYFPFEEELDFEKAFDKRMNGEQLPPPKFASESLGRVILKACEFDTQDRYGTIEEMLSDLEKVNIDYTQTQKKTDTAKQFDYGKTEYDEFATEYVGEILDDDFFGEQFENSPDKNDILESKLNSSNIEIECQNNINDDSQSEIITDFFADNGANDKKSDIQDSDNASTNDDLPENETEDEENLFFENKKLNGKIKKYLIAANILLLIGNVIVFYIKF